MSHTNDINDLLGAGHQCGRERNGQSEGQSGPVAEKLVCKRCRPPVFCMRTPCQKISILINQSRTWAFTWYFAGLTNSRVTLGWGSKMESARPVHKICALITLPRYERECRAREPDRKKNALAPRSIFCQDDHIA